MTIKEFIQKNWYDHAPSATWYEMIQRYSKGRKLGLDIGTSGGFSACAMALEGLDVDSIDPNLKGIAEKVATELSVLHRIDFYKMTSDDWFLDTDKRYDIIIIDGNHDYEFVYRDLDNSWDCLADNGVIICDDYDRYNGTRRAIDDWIAKNKPEKYNVDLGRMVIWR